MERNNSLDGMRGLAALAVAVGHCITHVSGLAFYSNTLFDFPAMPAWQIVLRMGSSISNADGAVVLFFVLSGHVLSRSLERKWQGVSYFVRRVFRLVPVGIVAAIPFCLYFNATLLDSIGTALLVDHSINGVIWSLQVEWVGSALIFLLCLAGSPLLAIASGAVLLWFGMHLNNAWMPLLLPAFALGFLVRWAPKVIARSRFVLVAAMAVFLFYDLFEGRGMWLKPVQMVAAYFMVACIAERQIGVLQSRVVQFLGNVSYPFYLTHTFFMMILTAPLGRMGLGMVPSIAVLAVASILLTLIGARIVHGVIEKPGIKAGNALLRRFPTLLKAVG